MPDRIADVLWHGWVFMLAAGVGLAEWFRGIDQTWKNLLAMGTIIGATILATMAFQERAMVLGALPERLAADSARVDSIRLEVLDSLDVLLDSVRHLAGESARRTESMRELNMQTNMRMDSLGMVVEDLLCVLRAAAEGVNPQEECRPPRPLPIVPPFSGGMGLPH